MPLFPRILNRSRMPSWRSRRSLVGELCNGILLPARDYDSGDPRVNEFADARTTNSGFASVIVGVVAASDRSKPSDNNTPRLIDVVTEGPTSMPPCSKRQEVIIDLRLPRLEGNSPVVVDPLLELPKKSERACAQTCRINSCLDGECLRSSDQSSPTMSTRPCFVRRRHLHGRQPAVPCVPPLPDEHLR